MWAILVSLFGAAVVPQPPDGLPAAPFNVTVGHQIIELREPLVARSLGVRLVLFVHGGSTVAFEGANPAGSVTAHLQTTDGRRLTLEHTGYDYYRGYSGLVLTEAVAAERGELFGHLELDAKVPLKSVRLVWLDRLARRVGDVRPQL